MQFNSMQLRHAAISQKRNADPHCDRKLLYCALRVSNRRRHRRSMSWSLTAYKGGELSAVGRSACGWIMQRSEIFERKPKLRF